MFSPLVLALAVLSSEPGSEIRLEGGASGYATSFVFPAGDARFARADATFAWLNLFPFKRLGFRFFAGATWYSALGFTPVDIKEMTSPVMMPTWWGLVGAVYRVPLLDALLWMDLDANIGAVGSSLALSQLNGSLASVSIGAQAAGLLGMTFRLIIEHHVAFTVGVFGMVYGAASPRAAFCSKDDLNALAQAEQRGAGFDTVVVSTGCQRDAIAKLPAGSAATAARLLESSGARVSGTLGVTIGVTVF